MVLFPIDANDTGEWLIGLEQIPPLVPPVRLKAKKKSKKKKNFKDCGQRFAEIVSHQTADLLLILPEGPRLMRCADQLRRNRSKLVLASCRVAFRKPCVGVIDSVKIRFAEIRLRMPHKHNKEFRPRMRTSS